jgi:PAS domain S-box-containing protein
MSSETYIQQLQEVSDRINEIYERTGRLPAEKSLIDNALQELNIAIEELRVADEEIRAQAEQLASANDAIEDQRYRYEEMFEFAPDGYVITDANGLIEEANQAAAQLLGVNQRLLMGKPLIAFIPSEDRHSYWKRLGMLDKQAQAEEFDIRIRPRKREALEVAATVCIVRDRRGRTSGRRWLMRDARARHLAEERRYNQIVSEITDYAIIRLDLEGRIRAWNRGAELIFGYLESEILGRNGALLYTQEDRSKDTLTRSMETARTEGRTAGHRWYARKDDSRFWGENVLTALHDSSGNVTGFIKIIHDQTEQKRAEDALSAAYEQQHRIADTLQSSMLHKAPRNYFPGLEIEIFYQSALDEAYVGGDFFDTFALEGGKVALTAGDVSGKGLKAASRITGVRFALRAFADEHQEVSAALRCLNNYICRSTLALPDEDRSITSFIALTLVVIDPATGDTEFASAGAEPAMILRSDGTWSCGQVGGIPLGIESDLEYSSLRAKLEPDEIILIATDGLTEARDSEGFLDQAGLAAIAIDIHKNRGQITLADLGREVMGRVTGFAGGSLRDDACLLLARRTKTPN